VGFYVFFEYDKFNDMDDKQKEIIIKLIEDRILAEYRKHAKSLPNDWAKIASHKIFASISEIIKTN
jgi:hypothetical protein